MIGTDKNTKVARCVAIGAQHATNSQNHATNQRNPPATNSLKGLAGAVLGRNTLRNNSATHTLNTAQQIPEKNSEFVAHSCADFPSELMADSEPKPNDTRRFCRQCLNHRPVKGRAPAKIRCEVQDRLWLDDIPRHCDDYQDNGDRPPVIGVRWTPGPINRHTATGTADQANQNITDGSVTNVNHAHTATGTSYPKAVTCYTPNGTALQIMAENQGRAEWLQRMNPSPKARP